MCHSHANFEVNKTERSTLITVISGFSLVELLVVMSILSLTVALLTEGLANTWKSFERLGSQELRLSSSQLPIAWFTESFEGAVLFHPNIPSVNGSQGEFTFTTIRAPNDPTFTPVEISWRLNIESGITELVLEQRSQQIEIVIAEYDENIRFEYRVDGNWGTSFTPRDNRLPEAVRIVSNSAEIALAIPGRDVRADVPAELARFGQYEF